MIEGFYGYHLGLGVVSSSTPSATSPCLSRLACWVLHARSRLCARPLASWPAHPASLPPPVGPSSFQVTSPVQWEGTLRTLLDRGLERSVELGPNKVIAGIMKRVDKTHPLENITV